jgi:hypothetical protein
MFAGLVEALGEVVNVADHGPGKRLVVDAGDVARNEVPGHISQSHFI